MANFDDKLPARSDAHRERLASALRANLLRRKAAARAVAKRNVDEPLAERPVPLELKPKD